MAPILYMLPASPPVRAVRLAAAAINLDLELNEVDLFGGAHLEEDYLKLNPSHTIPTLNDDGFILWDSHAIMAYLINKYGEDDSLYPKDVHKRAKVDQALHFDSSILFVRTLSQLRAINFDKEKELSEEKMALIHDGLRALERIIANNKYSTGDDLTIADFALVATVSSIACLEQLQAKVYPNIIAWIKRMELLPYYDVNKKGAALLATMLKSNMA